MPSENSITHWIGQLQRGNREAAQRLWESYFHRLVALARVKQRGRRRATADEEDVALSAVDSVFRGIEAGRYPQLTDRDDLWRLLVVITAHKAQRLVRDAVRQKRGGGQLVLGQGDAAEGEDDALSFALSREPTPEFAAEVAEQCMRLMDGLNSDSLREIAILKMDGFSNEEIAEQKDCTTRTIERKLRLIRTIWTKT